MIFLDSNVFLRFLTPPATAGDASRRAVAELLFELVENGDLEVTTSEVVLHEVSFVLCSPRQYRRKAAEVAPVLREMIQWPGFSIQAADLRVYLRALELWE
jgi:predicted nucleic acid-binding protein